MSIIKSSKKIDIIASFTEEPPPRDFIIPGLIPGIVGSIVAPGATGKSFLGLQLAMAVAGVDRWNFTNGSGKAGKVLYLSIEDGADEINRRNRAIAKFLESKNDPLTGEELSLMRENLTIRDLLTSDHIPDALSTKIVEKWLDDEGFEQSKTLGEAMIDEMIDEAKDHRLLIIDTLRNFHNGDENNSSQMAELLARLRLVAVKTKCAILFLHHTNKNATMSGVGDLQQASRGSSVLTDNVRYQANMSTLTEEEALKYEMNIDNRRLYVRFVLSKANYCAPQDEILFRREEGGVLNRVVLNERKTDKALKTKDKNEKYQIGEKW